MSPCTEQEPCPGPPMADPMKWSHPFETTYYGQMFNIVVCPNCSFELHTFPERAMSSEEKYFPLQAPRRDSGVAPHPLRIPWSVAEKAYSVYAGRYGRSQSLERLAERGGFGGCEMDELYPGWREEVSQIASLTAQLAEVTKRADEAEARADDWGAHWNRVISKPCKDIQNEAFDLITEHVEGAKPSVQLRGKIAALLMIIGEEQVKLTAAEDEVKRLREAMSSDQISRSAAKEAIEAAIVKCKHDYPVKPACKTQRYFADKAIAALDSPPAADGVSE